MSLANRVNYLDGVRGSLAVIVFIHHFIYCFYPELVFGGSPEEFAHTGPLNIKRLVALTPVNILFNPGMAIVFFFLLSGYVQTKFYFDTFNLSFLQRGFIKRYFRLAIPCLAVVILVFAFHRLGFIHNNRFPPNNLSADWAKSLLPDNLGFWQVVYQGGFECFVGSSRYYQVLWTLPIELANSYIVLALALTTHSLRNKAWVFLIWLFAQLFLLHFYNGAAFTCGMLFAYYQKNAVLNSFLERPLVKILCWIIGIYFASYPYTGYQNAVKSSIYSPVSFFDVYPHIISFLIGVVFIFAALSTSYKTQKLFSGKAFMILGNISYMFYLVHFLLLFSFSPWLFGKLMGHVPLGVNLTISFLLSFAVICIVSGLLYRFVDKPAIAFCNKYSKKLFGV